MAPPGAPAGAGRQAHLEQGVSGEEGAGMSVRPDPQHQQIEDGHLLARESLQGETGRWNRGGERFQPTLSIPPTRPTAGTWRSWAA